MILVSLIIRGTITQLTSLKRQASTRSSPPPPGRPRAAPPGAERTREHGVCVALSVELCECVLCGMVCVGVQITVCRRAVCGCVGWGASRSPQSAGCWARLGVGQVGSGGGHRCARGDEATLLRRPPPPPRAIHRTRPPKSHQPHSSQVGGGRWKVPPRCHTHSTPAPAHESTPPFF